MVVAVFLRLYLSDLELMLRNTFSKVSIFLGISMKLSITIFLISVAVVLLSGCTKSNLRQIAGSAVANGADTQVRYSSHECRTLRQQCVQGDFQEWQTSDKEMGCSCKKL